jgi:CheY-like chemotaxis protein
MIEQACTMMREAPQPVEYLYDRTILLLADSAGVRERLRRAARRAGYRVSGAASLAEASDRLDRQVAVNAVAVQVDERARAHLAPVLARLGAGAREGRHASIVAGPAGMIDELAAGLCHRDIYHLCEPDRADWMDALVAAAAPRPLRLSDVSKENGGPRLQQLSEEVGRIATILASLSDPEEGPAPDPGPARNASRRIQAGQIRAIIRSRRMRDQFFKGDLFADPAWDMLLDLMAARLEQRRVAVSSLCIAAAVPPTTALRWIKTLCEQGLFVRVADPQDGRRVFIELSDPTAASLEACLRSAQRISPLIM